MLELALDGFLPVCELTDQPKEEEKSLFRELGLPYVSDPAVTRHLAAFLASAGDAKPDAILFNGGFFIPEILRQRVADVMEHWYGRRPVIFENRDLDLAVAVGAAYYSYVRATGAGLLVRGGLPRVVLHRPRRRRRTDYALCAWSRAAPKKARRSSSIPAICNWSPTSRCRSACTARARAPRISPGEWSSSRADESELHLHAPLNAVLRFGKAGERLVPVKLGAKLTEVGTLEIWADSKETEHRWRLQFELQQNTLQADAHARAAAVVSDEALAKRGGADPATFAEDARSSPPSCRRSSNRRSAWAAIRGRSQPFASSRTGCWN